MVNKMPGVTVKIHYRISFDKSDKVFTSYIKEFYDLKSKSFDNPSLRQLGKSFLNNLYRRFALRDRTQITDIVNNSKMKEIDLKNSVNHCYPLGDDHYIMNFNK